MQWAVLLTWSLLLLAVRSDSVVINDVILYHLIDQKLFGETDGSVLQGPFNCPSDKHGDSYKCEIVSTDVGVGGTELMFNLASKYRYSRKNQRDALTVGLYSIHSWAASPWPHHPDRCVLPTLLNVAESEESSGRFHKLFSNAFPGYDGNSTTHPASSIPRSYVQAFKMQDVLPLVPFGKKLKAAAYVASTCHVGSRARPLREILVSRLEKHFRVDSLGKCHRTESTTSHPGMQPLSSGQTDAETLQLKQKALSNYLFYLAFENTIEAGYVTEKVFDSLKAGAVPVYLGDSNTCKKLLPHPKAAIFADDYVISSQGDEASLRDLKADRLIKHLEYLASNETAYSEYLSWRTEFGGRARDRDLDPLVRTSWPCRVCNWARGEYSKKSAEISRKHIESQAQCRSKKSG